MNSSSDFPDFWEAMARTADPDDRQMSGEERVVFVHPDGTEIATTADIIEPKSLDIAAEVVRHVLETRGQPPRNIGDFFLREIVEIACAYRAGIAQTPAVIMYLARMAVNCAAGRPIQLSNKAFEDTMEGARAGTLTALVANAERAPGPDERVNRFAFAGDTACFLAASDGYRSTRLSSRQYCVDMGSAAYGSAADIHRGMGSTDTVFGPVSRAVPEMVDVLGVVLKRMGSRETLIADLNSPRSRGPLGRTVDSTAPTNDEIGSPTGRLILN